MNRHISIILILFFIAKPSFAQKGFSVIHKAERCYEKGNGIKALKLLSKAEKMDYGFCGNAWMEANHAIYKLRAQIYLDQKKYQLSRQSLDSIYWESREENIDSVLILSYQLEFGKDSLRNMFDLSLQNATIESYKEDYYATIPLMNGTSMKIKIRGMNNFSMLIEEDKNKKLKIWQDSFRQKTAYQSIINKS